MAAMLRNRTSRPGGGWGAVLALTLCVSTLIASEFMPVSLLTPIASDLHVTEGQAGQAIAVSGIFAVLTSLFISSATRGSDRRSLLLSLTGVMIASGVIVAFAPNYPVFMVGRALIGVVIGGFWSMSTATVMRLVTEKDVPRALALLNGGNALATTIAAPLGSFLGQYIGWRGAFFCVVPLAMVTLAWKFVTLPKMPSRERASATAVFKILRRPQVPLGMLAVGLFFMGQFALFTYLRPFLETVTGVSVSTLSLILLILGVAGLAGTYAIGAAAQKGALQSAHWHAVGDGRHRSRPGRLRNVCNRRHSAARILGAYRHCCACRLVDLDEQSASGPSRSWRRPDGRSDPACDHGRRISWRPPVRRKRLPRNLRCKRSHSRSFSRHRSHRSAESRRA